MTSALAQAAPPKIGATLEPFTLKDLDGKDVTVSFDKKVNVVSFWVSTCALCKKELKAINELAPKYKDVNFVVVSMDFGGPELVKYVLKMTNTEAKVPILLDVMADVGTKKYGITRFPTMLIVGKGGTLNWYNDGWEEDSEQRIVSEIEFRLKQ